MRMYIDWFDTERISPGKISIVGATATHTSSSRGGIKLVRSTRVLEYSTAVTDPMQVHTYLLLKHSILTLILSVYAIPGLHTLKHALVRPTPDVWS